MRTIKTALCVGLLSASVCWAGDKNSAEETIFLWQDAVNSGLQVQPVQLVEPKFPARAAHERKEGFVTLSFQVSENGDVTDIRLIDGKNSRFFLGAAKEALSKSTFRAENRRGQAVAVAGLEKRYDFELVSVAGYAERKAELAGL